MKPKMLALILALTVVSWAQTSTQNTPTGPQQSTAPAGKAKCACCDKMASTDMNDMKGCCAHHDMQSKDSKETASCCSGKDAKSCCGGDGKSCARSDKDAKAASCKDCCSKDKMATGCGDCGKTGDKCCCSKTNTEKTAS